MNGWPSRDTILRAWANAVTARPRLVLVVCLALAAASVALTLSRLEFRADRSQLVDPELPWQKRYADFRARFSRWDEPAVVVIERGETPESRAAAERFIELLDQRLRADPRIAAVNSGFRVDEAPPGLVLTRPTDQVRDIVAQVSKATPVLVSPGLEGLLRLSDFGGTSIGASDRRELAALLGRIASAGKGEGPGVLGLSPVQRLETRSGKLAVVLVSLARSADGQGVDGVDAESGVNNVLSSVRAVREHLAAVRGEPGLGGVPAGMTGVPVLESDETDLSMRDATLAGSLSLALITLLMVVTYRGVVVPLLAMASLLIGMAWSFAWATLAVGHLQLLSVTFASLLLGLGIDVAIHLIARLELLHADHDHLGEAIALTFRGVGPGILTASVTVAAAAAAMALTSFAGVGEMGIIAAGGMLLCTLSIMCALPAMLMLMPRPERRLLAHDGGVSRPFMGRLGPAFHRRPALVLSGAAVLVGAAGWLAAGVRYDTDLLKLMPTSTESVVWQQAIEADDAKSVWHAVVITGTEEEARSLTEGLRALPEVGEVEGVGMLYQSPVDIAARQELLRGLPDVSGFAPSTGAGAAGAGAVRRTASALAERWKERDAALASAAAAVAGMADQEIGRAQESYARDRATLMQQVGALRSAEPTTLAALPAAIRDQMVGSDGSLLLRVQPRDPGRGESVLAPARLAAFASAVLGSAPGATGPSIQIYESTRLINEAYLRAGVYSLIAIIGLLLIDFGLTRGGVLDTACAMVPVLAGATLMLALMRLCDVPLNFANMIVMPLIVGIGVGCGVHAVRRWRLQPNDPPLGLAGGSGRAITLTTLTTVIGFATMMTGEHRGIWSLGFVMSVGLAMVWLVTILLVPSLLALRRSG